MISVVLVDDQALLRAGFRALIDVEADLEVVGEAGDGEAGLDLIRQVHPDVVLMDVRMPKLDGIAATQRVTEDADLADVRVIILTTFELDEYVFDALRNGAAGFLLKDTEPADLLAAIRIVADGDALMSPSITRRLIAEFASRSRPSATPAVLDVLTEREREIVALVGEGLSNGEIAERLVVSPATAKTHVSRALTKLGVRDRAQLVVLAYETGLVRPGWTN